MPDTNNLIDRPDPVIEYYKQFVDREALRANLKLTPDKRLTKLGDSDASGGVRHSSQEQSPRWEAISDTGPDRKTDPVIELYKRDVDRTLLRENLRRTLEQRLQQLDAMGEFVDELHTAARARRDRQ